MKINYTGTGKSQLATLGIVFSRRTFETKLQKEHLLLGQLPPLSINILEIAKSRGQITIRDIVTITEANRNTVKKHLENLVLNGQLQKYSVGKGTFYTR